MTTVTCCDITRPHNSLVVWVGAAYILASTWTRTFGEEVGQGISGRLVPGDLVGAFFVFIWLVSSRQRPFRLPGFCGPFLILLGAIAVGNITSLDPRQTAIEFLILAFLGATCCALVDVFSGPRGFETICSLFAAALCCVSILGLYDATAGARGLERVVARDPDAPQIAIAGFRNSGQAGAYALVVLSVVTPLRFSQLYRQFGRVSRSLMNSSLLLGTMFLLFTAKLAGWVGWLVGFCLYIAQLAPRKPRKALILAVAVALFVGAALTIAPVINPSWANWVEFKVEKHRGEDRNDTFFQTNYGRAVDAFVDRPLLGTGIGAFQGQYDEYEVHSTYLKMLAEGGVIVALAYVGLMLTIIVQLFRSNGPANRYRDFLIQARPFFFGCLVSWIYTYHLRKREFWIMIAIFWIARSLSHSEYSAATLEAASVRARPGAYAAG